MKSFSSRALFFRRGVLATGTRNVIANVSPCVCSWRAFSARPCQRVNHTETVGYRWLSSVVDPAIASSIDSAAASIPASIEELLQSAQIDRAWLEELATQQPTTLCLKDMYAYGTAPNLRIQNAQFLYKELPVRLAQRAVDLLTLPHGLSEAVPIRQVASIYLQFLRRFQEFPKPTTVEQEELFTDMLQSFVLDRTSIPISIAQGVTAWWQKSGVASESSSEGDRLQEMEEALHRFFTARVGLRFLTEHYVLSSNRESANALRNVTSMFPQSEDDTVGCIQTNVNVVKEIRRVADLVTHQTKEYYGGLCPAMHVVDCVEKSESDFTFVPQHLHYVMSELLKNSCRSSVRRYKELNLEEIPPIRVIIVKGDEDVTIKIADKGGGIPRSLMATIWKFAHSTASEDEFKAEFGTDVSGAKIRGFGLPLARIYARYFGGELTLKSTEGYGLDAYLHLQRLGEACENLPLRVRQSPAGLISLPTTAL